MESIRNFLKSGLGKIFLVICLSPLLIFGLQSYFGGSANTNEVAKVGNQSVTRSDYQNAISAQRNELLKNGVEPSLINNTALNEQVLTSLINQALLRQQAQHLGMHVSDAVINEMLLKDPQFLDEQGQFSNDRFAFFLKQQGLTKDQLFSRYRQQLNISQLYNALAQTAVYPEDDIKRFIALQQETRQTWRYQLPWQAYADKVTVSDVEIEEYYNEHKQALNSRAMVDLSYVTIDPDTLSVETVTEEDVQEQYEAFKASFAGSFKQRISHILLSDESAAETMKLIEAQLKEGASFESLANKYSQDSDSKQDGGDIGIFYPEAFGADAQKVEQALQGLGEGDISQPVKTEFGYQIFKVTKVEGEAIPSLESMREQLTERAKQQKREILFADKVTRINDMATDGVSIEDIAQTEGLKLNKIKDYSKTNNTTVLNQPAVIEAAFDDFTIQDESVSTNIAVNNVTVWVQPANYRPVAPLTLEQASSSIKQTLIKQKAIDLALQQAQSIASKVNSQGMEAADVKFESLGEISRQTQVLTADEKATVFSQDANVSKLQAVTQKTDMGASVLVVDKMKQLPADTIPQTEVTQVANMLRQRRGEDEFTDYLHYLEMAVDIEKNEDVINEMTGI